MPSRPAARAAVILLTASLALAIAALLVVAPSPTARAEGLQESPVSGGETDQEVPPGNPVVGSDAPGDVEQAGTNYGLWALIAGGLIVGGSLLVKLEGWEKRRAGQAGVGP